MEFESGELDLSGISKFLYENPTFRLQAFYTGKDKYCKFDGISFLVGVYQRNIDLYKPGISTPNLGAGLAIISKTAEGLSRKILEQNPVIECANVEGLPLHEVLPNLASILKNNKNILMYAGREGGKIVTALSTYYDHQSTMGILDAPIHLFSFRDEFFRPDLLEKIRISDYTIGSFLNGLELTALLDIRNRRLKTNQTQ